MKKIASIFFLSLLLFNWVGYGLFLDLLQSKHDFHLESMLDKDQYNDAELISIKTPLNMPYYTASLDYERVDGSVDVNGVEYKYVKRRVHNDTLELLCLPNKVKMSLESAKIDFVKFSGDASTPAPGKKSANSNNVKHLLPEYCQAFQTFSLKFSEKEKNKYFSAHVIIPVTDYCFSLDRPPEIVQNIS